MKRYNFTINEMLAVVAIIGVLSALVFPALSYARARARATNCLSNQGQVMKMLQNGMSRAKDQLISAEKDEDPKKMWTTSLYERNIMKAMDVSRCPAMKYKTSHIAIDTEAARKEAYGVVIATNGKLDFRSTKLRKAGSVTVAPNNLLIGGCTSDGYETANPSAALDVTSDGINLTAIHRKEVNVFFLDGSAGAFHQEDFKLKKFYYPKKDNSSADEVPTDKLLVKDE